jgi:hypothetical protein
MTLNASLTESLFFCTTVTIGALHYPKRRVQRRARLANPPARSLRLSRSDGGQSLELRVTELIARS